MNQHLCIFLTRYLAWAEAGAVTKEFKVAYGLCENFTHWMDIGPTSSDMTHSEWVELRFSLIELLDGLADSSYPFGGSDRYYEEMSTRSHHKNDLRLAWVREQLEK